MLYEIALFSVTLSDPNYPKLPDYRHKLHLRKRLIDQARFGTKASLGLSYTVLKGNSAIS